MAVTRDGIPVRVWCWPGDTADSALIRQVKEDMRDWTLSRVVWVADRGFTSAENRRYLRKGDQHYIIGGETALRVRRGPGALSRQGRYQDVAENLRVKEVRISDSERFVICFNPEGAERDAKVRDVAAGMAWWEAAISACLSGMRDRGQLIPAADPAQLATAILAALKGGLALAQVERNVRLLAAALDVMISLVASLAPQAGAKARPRLASVPGRPGFVRVRWRAPDRPRQRRPAWS